MQTSVWLRRAACRSALRHCLVAGFVVLAGLPAMAAPETHNVLALYSSFRTLPANIEADRGLRDALVDTPQRHIELYAEFLDVPRFGGEAYADTVAAFLRNKYTTTRPDVIFVGGDDALAFVLTYRARLFPTTPTVYAGISPSALGTLGPLPPDVAGLPVDFDSLRTIALALRLHPKATRLVVVTGLSEEDKGWEARLRGEVGHLPAGITTEFFSGLPSQTLRERLGALGRETIVYSPGFFLDGEGRGTTPRASARFIADASAAPVYGPYNTFIDTGVVGGYMPSFYDIGVEAGRMIGTVLNGVALAKQPPVTTPLVLNLDWRQVQRWGIDPKLIPEDAVVQFREPSLWEAHRVQVVVAVLVLLVQSALIIGLLFERRRRHAAEHSVQAQRLELAHASRLAIAGELTASIAHEINQPLGAILANADAGEMILQSEGDPRAELRAILRDIRADDRRASEVIRRLRELLDNHAYERALFQFNDVLRDLHSILGSEGRRRGVKLDIRPADSDATVRGDRIQIQQVLINLVLNAMDAVGELPEERRVVTVLARNEAGHVYVDVRDTGNGIAPEHLPRLFDSFFTTKLKGMGLGLSIARTLVGAHGGHIWADNLPGGGAVFHIEIPTLEQRGVAMEVA